MLAILFSLIFLSSCNLDWDKIDKPETVNDSATVVTKFNSNKEVIDSFGEVKGKIEGLRYSFDEKGKVKIYSNYKNGKLNGKENGYHLNGKLAYTTNFVNDTAKGETFFYYENGSIEQYQFKSYLNGVLTYQRFYDKQGNTTKSLGRGLIQFNRKKDTVKVDEEYIGEFVIATPPKTNAVIMIADFNSDSTGTNHVIFEGKEQIRTYKAKFNKQGSVKKIVFWAIEDSLDGQVHKGKKVLHIFVKK